MIAKRKAWAERPGDGSEPPGRAKPVHYPERDGKPMGETEVHAAEIMRLILTLRDHYAGREDVYVWGDLLLYYEEGNPRAVVVPDVFVALGASREPQRRIYKLWEEGVPPTFVIEVTSPSTRRIDLGRKRDLYARLGVAEYVLYDPLDEYLSPPLQGFTLEHGAYRQMAQDTVGALISSRLGLRLLLVNGRLRLIDASTGAPLLSPEERAAEAAARAVEATTQAAAATARAAEAEARAAAEAEARRRAEQRIAELEAGLRRRGG
jgi:Uma2 family endonuclease